MQHVAMFERRDIPGFISCGFLKIYIFLLLHLCYFTFPYWQQTCFHKKKIVEFYMTIFLFMMDTTLY